MITSTSSARMFLDHLRTQLDPFAYLCSIAEPKDSSAPYFEEEWLDFKGRPATDKDAKEIWSKALSGYSNIVDGIIIWGIDARKTHPRGIDAACGLRLIPDPYAFESRLRDWIRDATNPPVVGAEFQSFPGPNREGFVVCLIPQSNHRPHRAEWAHKHYYYRAGDDFLPAEPGLLRVLFYPQRSCHIQVSIRLEYTQIPPDWPTDKPSFEFNFTSLVDVGGSSSGRDAYLTVQWHPGIEMSVGIGRDWQYFGHSLKKGFRANRTIHPGEQLVLFYGRNAKLETKWEIQNDQWVLHWKPIVFEFEVFITDQERQSYRLLFEEGCTSPGELCGTVQASNQRT